LEAAVQRLVLLMSVNPDEARILIVESSGLSPRLEQIRRNIIDSHAQSVERALAALASVLPPMDVTVVARCWVGAMYESVYHWPGQSPNERRPARIFAAAVSDFNLRGIGVPARFRPDATEQRALQGSPSSISSSSNSSKLGFPIPIM
jgi:TetR/AcrR family transcriptional regulator, fatty acid metabolism regulator protein